VPTIASVNRVAPVGAWSGGSIIVTELDGRKRREKSPAQPCGGGAATRLDPPTTRV